MNDELKVRIEQLTKLFPDDERFRNAILMATGVNEELPVLSKAFGEILDELYKPGADGPLLEVQMNLALGDVLQWLPRLEIALHDLRSSLFFRYNKRVKAMHQPTDEELAGMTEAVEREERAMANKAAAKKTVEGEKPKEKKPKEDKSKEAASKIRGLFADV